jgi:hypothetical protein
MNILNLFGKTLTGRNIDTCMMFIGKYLVQQEEVGRFFDLNHAILALQQNYGFVSIDKIEAFTRECHRFYVLQKDREPIEINKSAFNKFRHDAKNGLTIEELSQRNQDELYANLQSLLC